MSPRRKKSDTEDEAQAGAAEPTPKKKRTSAKKAPPAPKDDGALLGIPTAPAFQPPTPPMPPPAPKPPVTIPIKPIPAARPIEPMARMKIEPEIHIGEAQDHDVWTPAKKDETDLSVPPPVLLQKRKMPQNMEVEDILEETEAEPEGNREHLRPTVRTGFYRKIAIGFAALALIVGALVMYVTYAHATIIIHPSKIVVHTERVMTVSENPQGNDEVPGEVLEVTVAGEKSGNPSGSTVTDAVATGFVTLINDSSKDQVLIPTTRLLSADGVLFRIKSRVTVPAKGSIKTEVYADQAGKTGDIGPTTFTIPGLNPAQQKLIYARSDDPMTGGTKATGTVSDADIEAIETALRVELTLQADAELTKRLTQAWTGKALLAETMTRFVSAAPGETADAIIVRLSLRVRLVAYDRAKALEVAVEDLKRGLTSDRELIAVYGDEAEITVERADPKEGTATIRVALTGESSVSMNSPLFDASKLKGMDFKDAQAYFEGIEGVESVEFKFRPFWLKRMPVLEDRIEFKIEK